MKHLRLFKTNADYESATLELPNVSFVEENTVVKYNPGLNSSLEYIMVDLGLPSGLLWADRNVGATSPEDVGLYFAWGETDGYTEEQVEAGEKIFDWDNYFDTNDGGSTFNKYAVDKIVTLESADDAASVFMGADWRMPTETEVEELYQNTEIEMVNIDNIAYAQFTSLINGNHILMPLSGYFNGSSLRSYNSYGYYWQSSLSDQYSAQGRYYMFRKAGDGISHGSGCNKRYYGYTIRGVK